MHVLAIILLILGMAGTFIGGARIVYGEPQDRAAEPATARSGLALLLISVLVVFLVAGVYLLGMVP